MGEHLPSIHQALAPSPALQRKYNYQITMLLNYYSYVKIRHYAKNLKLRERYYSKVVSFMSSTNSLIQPGSIEQGFFKRGENTFTPYG